MRRGGSAVAEIWPPSAPAPAAVAAVSADADSISDKSGPLTRATKAGAAIAEIYRWCRLK